MAKQQTEDNQPKEEDKNTCPKCGSPLSEPQTTKTGKLLQRCSTGNWNPDTRQTEGCDFVKWLTPEPEALDEKCPKCGSPLLSVTTRFGKKMKRCSTNKWDPQTRTSTGCDFVEWQKSTREELDEECPTCGAKLVMMTTAAGKQFKKCSTSGWDSETKTATGCAYIDWLN